ncbi:uncharacterized protein G2W53_033737 [Senna tora]|uniref:Uncharacterized protein n=1 Tax=Senna tora TaxID=362788 RepID=A0A834T1T0_9FABA|nr:uncharacterized protein G2W53_033737 [Senna tora]
MSWQSVDDTPETYQVIRVRQGPRTLCCCTLSIIFFRFPLSAITQILRSLPSHQCSDTLNKKEVNRK